MKGQNRCIIINISFYTTILLILIFYIYILVQQQPTNFIMKKSTIIALCVSACLISSVLSIFTVHSPATLKLYFTQKYMYTNNGSIPYSIANFGNVPYGKSLIAQLQTPAILQNCIYQDIPDDKKTKKAILSQRNDCKFSQKALNTEKQGGILSIIMDNVVQNPGRIIMVDDGHGAQIHIPTILISKQDGETILNVMKNTTVQISVSFDTLKSDLASLNLYLDITDRNNFIFLRRFKPYFDKIKDHVNMTVNYATTTCEKCEEGDCYYNGSFCKRVLYGWLENTGQIFIKEQLRQYFIHKQEPSKWWSYMNFFDLYCSQTTQQKYLQDCSINQMKAVQIDSDKILKLVDSSFGNQTNEVLLKSATQRQYSQVMYYPTIVINNITYRGNLEPFEVQQMICSSLKSPPSSCVQNPFQPKSSHIFLWIFIAIVGFLMLLMFIIFCYRRFVRRSISNNMNKQVNQLVNQYITMYQADKFQGDQQLIQKQEQQSK